LPQARRIPLSRRSHIIGFQALPNGTASHESALERDFVTLTSFSNPAAIIRSQPVTIAFDDEGFRRRYTPDFLVTCETSAELVEVKYEHDLKTQWKRLHPAFRAAEHWASTHHATFRVITERDIRGSLLDNAKRLLPLRALPVDAKMAMLALTRAHTLSPATFRTLLPALPDRRLALATLWRLIARGRLLKTSYTRRHHRLTSHRDSAESLRSCA
jgi:hypothetical protein